MFQDRHRCKADRDSDYVYMRTNNAIISNNQSKDFVVLLSSTKMMTKYRRQRTFITWRKRDETQRKCWSCDDDYN